MMPLVLLMFMIGLLSWTLQDFIKRKAEEGMIEIFGLAGQDIVDITLLVTFAIIVLILAYTTKRRLDWSDAVLGNTDV
jgi:hypothetical protein